jgi:hypothetical protein
MLVQIEASKELANACVRKRCRGEDATREITMAKLFTGRMCRLVSDTCIQLHGGFGYMRESAAGRAFVDMRLISIGGGADEVMIHYLAKMLGFARISFVEFGVAGGNGLVVLERIAETVERFFGLKIDVHGFDVGEGLPRAMDYRDLPNIWREGSYRIDRRKLEERLKTSHLHIGLVEKTVEEFKASNPSPVAFISFDLDLYSSTVHAFKLLTGSHETLLPRIHCYFDDIMGKTFSDFTGSHIGEILAIVLDKVVISVPAIQGQIPEGEGIIEGSFTAEEAYEELRKISDPSLPQYRHSSAMAGGT